MVSPVWCWGQGCFCHSHFTKEETEAQRAELFALWQMTGKVMQTEPEEAVLPHAARRSLGTSLSFLGQSRDFLHCPPLRGGELTDIGVNWRALCGCALYPPEGAGAFVSGLRWGGG